MGLQWRMRPLVTGGFTQKNIRQIFQLEKALIYIKDVLTMLGS